MARTIEQIKRDIVALEQACQVLATEITDAYASYLTALGQAVRQQAVLASYHLCTQGYPEAFLKLSFNQRQKLQQDVRKVLHDAIEQLLMLTKVDEADSQTHADANSAEQINTEAAESPLQTIVSALEEPVVERVALIPRPSRQDISSKPTALSQWQQGTEQAIAHHLKTTSRDLNYLLQTAGILPETLPFGLIEAALDSPELPTEATAGPPNLLNLLVEADTQESEASVTTLVAIYLRLGEIEFADVAVRAGRNQIRQLETRLRSLTREYHKKEREQAIAEAEAAWRASWFED